MAEILEIGGTDLTAYLFGDSLKIEQAAGEFAAVCSFQLTDPDSSLAVAKGDAVVVSDGGTKLFAGEVTNVDGGLLRLGTAGEPSRWSVECQDYNILVEEAVVDGLEEYSGLADSAIIADLFGSYRADIDAVSYVATIDAAMTMSFVDVTLREALATICGQTGGRWYVDEEKRLHYFTTEANVAAWHLSDTPDGLTSFPYQDIRRKVDATPIVNRVRVVGQEISGWVADAASQAIYGVRPGIVRDNRVTDSTALADRGAAVLARWAWPRVSYQVTTRKSGLRAGMDVRVVCAAWALDDTLTVRRLSLSWRGGHLFYGLELGDGVAAALTTGGTQIIIDHLGTLSGAVLEVRDSVYDTDAPAAPTFTAGNLSSGVDIDADGHQVVYLQATWGSVSDADLAYYEIQIGTSADLSGYTITRTQKAGGARIERFLPVLGNTTYYARVRAVDWVGNVSAWSDVQSITTAKDTTPPATPTGFTVTATPASVHLLWDANTEADLAGYDIFRKPDGGAYSGLCESFRGTFFIDNTCVAGTAYWYRVRAVDTSGNASATATAGAAVTAASISGTWTDLGLLGWSHNLVFSATDHDTVAWAAGAINLPSGATYNIDAGNTGNMAAVTYVYLDTAVSATVLQVTTTASQATGAARLLIAVCQNVAAGKDAIFQVFGGGATGGVLITADNITAATVTTNEIAANTIVAGNIAAGTITATQIAAGTITGDRIAATTITAANIAASTITADKMNVATLSAITANLGTITAGTVTGATIRTAASGARVVLDSTSGIQAYNSSGTQRVSIQTSGAGWLGANNLIVWNDAGTLTVGNWTVGATALYNGSNIGLEASTSAPHPSLWIKSSTWLNAGMQMQYNAGTPRFFIGSGTGATDGLMGFDGTYLFMQGGTSGSLRINLYGVQFLSGVNNYNGLSWYGAWADSYPVSVLRYSGSDAALILRTGAQDSASFTNLWLQQQTNAGVTTALRITSDERIGIWEDPEAIVHIRKRSTDTQSIPVLRVDNDDTDSGRPVLYLSQLDADQPFVNFADGTKYTGKTEADEYVKVDAFGATRYLRLHT